MCLEEHIWKFPDMFWNGRRAVPSTVSESDDTNWAADGKVNNDVSNVCLFFADKVISARSPWSGHLSKRKTVLHNQRRRRD